MCINAKQKCLDEEVVYCHIKIERGLQSMNVNWDDIRFFLAVSRTNSFVSAAQHLQVTHSTVSRRITALEEELESQLFVRTERGCTLTAAGEKLLSFAENMERHALGFQDQAAGNDRQISGKIRIGTPDGLGTCFLAYELNALMEKNPLLEVELVSVPIYYSLSKREVDILITVKRPSIKKVVAEKITNYRLGLFGSKEYLDGKAGIETPDDLKKHRLVGYIDDLMYDQRLRFLEDILPDFKTVFRSSTLINQMNAIKAGLGIGVIPYFMAHFENDLVQVLPENYVEREFWVQVNPDSSQSHRVRETMTYIIDAIHSKNDLFTAVNPDQKKH